MEILNEKEIKFLEESMKDYKDTIDYIIKCCSTIKTIDFICYNGGRLSIPFNRKTKLFRGMRANKKYTPEELGLFIDKRDKELKKIKKQLAEKDKEIERLKLAIGFEPTLKEQELYDKYLDFVMFAHVLRTSKSWREINGKEVSNETNNKTKE